ncbi:MAG: hypothetical protein GX171_02960 [Clostridiales bacterium]|nr:hypothetical protein [Clostridiales bacterium]
MNQIITPYKILSADCDRHGFWRMNRILVLMQELAGEHSEQLGFSFANTLKLGAVWVVTRNEFEVLRYPVIGQRVIGRSFPGRARRGIYPRYYQIEDEQGKALVRGSSFWALADVETRSMTDRQEIVDAMPDNSALTPYFRNPMAPEEVQGEDIKTGAWQPVYTDLDRNGHVNNTRAADWALCFLSQEADLSRHPVKSLAASYHKEMLEGQQVDLAFSFRETAFGLRCETNGEAALKMSGTLSEKAVPPGEALY